MSAMRESVWQLRPDVELIESVAEDGSPSVLVHDPVGETFDRVDWPEADVVRLLRAPGTLAELLARFTRSCTLRPAPAELAAYARQLAGKGWLRSPRAWPGRFVPRPAPGFAARFAGLLFLQIPLCHPARFLRATAGFARLFLNGFFAALVVLAGLSGLYLALPRWEEFWTTVSSSATLAGAPGFLLALVAVKTAHEFAHAYTATLAGARVKSMGVALFFFMPLPFTDVTDGWRLPWPARLRVATAGLFAELAVGAGALLLWALAPPGEAAAVLARLATAAIASTLATNLNPGIRFDGYFILVCLLRAENLRARGAAALRARAMRVFFGVIKDGEDGGGGLLHVYAVYALAYRMFIGAALVTLAYVLFPKAVGLPVAALEAYILFLLPIARECSLFWRSRGAMRFTFGTLALIAALAASGVWFFGEWPRRVSFPAVTRAEVEEVVRPRRAGILKSIHAARGDSVEAGQVLAELGAPAEPFAIERAEWALREAEIAADQSWAGALSRRGSLSLEAERRRREDELSALRSRSALLAVRAPAAGVLAAWDESLAPGVAVPVGGELGSVVRGEARRLACYPEVEAAGRFDVGAEAFFWPDTGGGRVRGEVVAIGEFARAAQGSERAAGAPRVEVTVLLDAAVDRVGQTGVVAVRSRPESLAARAAGWLRNLAVRESAF